MRTLPLSGKRILVTQSGDFMGPALCEVLAGHGATVIADAGPLLDPARPAAMIEAAGQVDVRVANLAIPAPTTPALDVAEDGWRAAFGRNARRA